jgi:hypothetical protein
MDFFIPHCYFVVHDFYAQCVKCEVRQSAAAECLFFFRAKTYAKVYM